MVTETIRDEFANSLLAPDYRFSLENKFADILAGKQKNWSIYEIYNKKKINWIMKHITTLENQFGWNNWSKVQAQKALKKSYYSIVIYDNENAIGMGRVVGDGIYFTIVDIVVRPEYQGKKIGTGNNKTLF